MNYFKKFKGGKSIEKFLDCITSWERKGKKGKKENRKAKLVCITYNACISMYVKSVFISNSMYNLGLTSLGF